MRHRRATINESFGAWEFLYINSGCPVRGEELVHFQFYCEDFHSKIFHISLVYWRNTALSSLAIHTVWLRSSALSCTNIPALLIKSFYQELV